MSTTDDDEKNAPGTTAAQVQVKEYIEYKTADGFTAFKEWSEAAHPPFVLRRVCDGGLTGASQFRVAADIFDLASMGPPVREYEYQKTEMSKCGRSRFYVYREKFRR